MAYCLGRTLQYDLSIVDIMAAALAQSKAKYRALNPLTANALKSLSGIHDVCRQIVLIYCLDYGCCYRTTHHDNRGYVDYVITGFRCI